MHLHLPTLLHTVLTRGPSGRALRRRAPQGFTLIELLVVVAIMAIMVTIVVPTVTSTEVARVRSATRGVMQMSRYARTMAILRQQTLNLEFSSDGTLKLSPGESMSGAASSASAATITSGDTLAERSEQITQGGGKVHITREGDKSRDPEESEEAESGTADGGSPMGDVETEKKFEQIRFKVEIDENELNEDEREEEVDFENIENDEEEDENGKTKEATTTIKVPYESNGRCLPYTVTIFATSPNKDADIYEEQETSGDVAVVRIDRFGNATVDDEDNPKRITGRRRRR